MNIIPWRNKSIQRGADDPFDAPLTRMRQEMDQLFDRFLGGWGPNLMENFGSQLAWGPRLDLAESESDITVKAEIPGVEPGEVDVRVEGNTLTLRGEKKREKEEKRKDYHYVERQYGAFHRSVLLPSSADPARVDAAFKDGVLTVTIAKRPEAKAKKIPVKTA